MFKIVFPASVLFLMVLYIVGWLVPASGEEIIIETNLLEVADEVYVLETMPRKITREQVLKMALELFNMRSEPQFTDNAWKIVEGSRELSVYASGGIKYFDNDKMCCAAYTWQELPLTENCIAIAEQFLRRLKAEGITSRSLQISFSDVANDTITIYYTVNGSEKTMLNNIHVNFMLYYDGLPLWGPGAKVRVYIGKGGEIIGFIGSFWEVNASQKVRILKPRQAVEKLRELGYGVDVPRERIIKAVVESVELVYFTPSLEAEFTKITPAYVIKGKVYTNDGVATGFLQMLPAIP